MLIKIQPDATVCRSLQSHSTCFGCHSTATATSIQRNLIRPRWRGVAVEVKTECDGTRAETRFGLPAKRTSPFISAGVSVQSAADSRGVRISGSNAG